MPKVTDLIGLRFGRLVVVRQLPKPGGAGSLWECKCDCGGVKEARSYNLRGGFTQSCGCLFLEQRPRKHGFSNHPLYDPWMSMHKRCKPNSHCAKDYFARGISVCERWQSVVSFIEDMEPTFEVGLTLDRIDNDAGYSPENCRWATRQTQSRNRRFNRYMDTPRGNMLVAEAAKEFDIPYTTLLMRLNEGVDPFEARRGVLAKKAQKEV